MIHTLHQIWLDRLMATKIVLSLLSLFMSGGITGVFVTIAATRHVNEGPNTHVFLALKPAPEARVKINPQLRANEDTVLAVHDEKLQQIARENEVSIADRKLLHDELARVQDRETGHYNMLNDRLNVDEARASTAFWVIGIFFGALNSVSTLLSILEFRSKRMKT